MDYDLESNVDDTKRRMEKNNKTPEYSLNVYARYSLTQIIESRKPNLNF